MDIAEIKHWQLSNQYLIEPGDKLSVVRDLCGIQAQFMSNAVHALKIRCWDFQEETVKDGLVKNWTIRGTVHVFREADLPIFIHCDNGRNYRRNEWNDPSFWNQRGKWALTPERQRYFSEIIVNALKSRNYTREELKQLCIMHTMDEAECESMFDPWGGGIRELCQRGFINYVVQEKKEFCIAPDFCPIPESDAQLELARRYFTHYGPATVHDAMYFFHVSAKQVMSWLSSLPAVSCQCEDETYYYIENGRSNAENIPNCIFLAGFDPLMLGYEKKESLYLQPMHIRRIFNLAGIVMPALLLRGDVIGKWKKKNGTVRIDLFQSISQAERRIVGETAESLWNDVRKIDFKEV